MKYFGLIWTALFRSRTRTLLTLLSVTAAFLLFGLLDSVRVAFNSSTDVAGYDRLITSSKLSITQMLPYSLAPKIESVPGVEQSVYAAWFGGYYRDPKDFFPNFSVGPGFFDLYPEYRIPKAQVKAFADTRNGAVVGRALAKQHGWKIGDNIPMQATIFPTGGSNAWQFTLVGIFEVTDPKRAGEEKQLVFNWKYFEEANDFAKGRVGWFIVKMENPNRATEVARAIDALSENSDHETKTQTEQAFNQAFIKQFADIGVIVSAIMGAVFFTLVLLTGNTVTQSMRERIPEFAVLKTIGFSNRTVLWLVLGEAMLLLVLGGVLGIGLAQLMIPSISAASGGVISLPAIPAETWAMGFGLMLVIGAAVGILPALRAMRLNIVDALANR